MDMRGYCCLREQCANISKVTHPVTREAFTISGRESKSVMWFTSTRYTVICAGVNVARVLELWTWSTKWCVFATCSTSEGIRRWWVFAISVCAPHRYDVPMGNVRWKLLSRTWLTDGILAVVACIGSSLIFVERSTRLFVETYAPLADDVSHALSVVGWRLTAVVGCLAQGKSWTWPCTYWCRPVDLLGGEYLWATKRR